MQKFKHILKSLFTFNKIVIAITVMAIGYLLLSSGGTSTKDPEILSADNQIVIDDHVEGNRNAQVVIIEYYDLQCPACAGYESITMPVIEKYKDSIAFVKRHFPLSMHANAMLAAKASEAASLQGKYYEMKDVLFAKQSEWGNSVKGKEFMISYANTLGLDVQKFVFDLESEGVENRVLRDLKSGQRAGVAGTPSFFINGKYIDNGQISNQAGWDEAIANAYPVFPEHK